MADGKIVLKGIVTLVSPALIGSGNNERSDCDVILDSEGKPFIPATSLIGVLQHNIKPSKREEELKKFWGYTEGTDSFQSCVLCSDLYLQNEAQIIIRDGIKIDNRNGMVEFDEVRNTGKKYDYQVIDRGAEFGLKIVINFSDRTKVFCEQMAATIKSLLENEKVRIGAKTNSGLGRVNLTKAALQKYSFNKKPDVFNWLTGKDGDDLAKSELVPFDFEIGNPVFTINATLKLKNSFIIRSYAEDATAPDSTSIKSGGEYVITGSALKGAIRSRAERILNTVKANMAQQIIDDLFGYVVENNSKSKAKKGRIRIDEVILLQFCTELQSRIKIDRFTGGVLEGALFDSMSLFSKKEEIENFTIQITNCKEYEAGLLLLVLKDIWTGDLAVGGEKNVGRGVFEGVAAEITWKDKKVLLKKNDLSGLSELSNFVESLTNWRRSLVTTSNGLEHCIIKTKVKTIKLFSLTGLEDLKKCVELYIKTDSLVVSYLDYTVLVGRYKSNVFDFFDNQSLDPIFIQKIRIFNEHEELLLWRSDGAFKGRYRKDGDGDEKPAADSMQVLFGTESEYMENNYTRLTEKRGTKIILPFQGLTVNDKKNRVFIKTRNYIDYNDAHQATYVDCRFVGFYRWNGETSKTEEIGNVKEK